MAAFTDISDWTSAQDTADANEIVLAYSERRQCVGDAAVDPLDAGDNAQDTAFWKGMQDWVKTQVDPTSGNSKWIDHTQTIEGEESLPYYTLPAFKYNSGLTGGDDSGTDRVVGFRRATTWPADWTDYADAAYSYGPIQAGDIRGPWIFDDLQKAFDALRWTFDVDNGEYDSLRKQSYGSSDTSYADALSSAKADWDSSSYSAGGVQIYLVEMNSYESSGTPSEFRVEFDRVSSTLTFDGIQQHVPHAATVYIDFSGNNDCDSYPLDSTWFEFDAFIAATTDTRTTTQRTGQDTYPEPTTYTFGSRYGAEDNLFGVIILKWEFSHTL